jgi:chromosome segregation ATPase
VEIYNYPPYASQEATENRNNLYYQKYGPPAYGQPQIQEGAFQTSQKVSETSWKGWEKNLASYYECDPETRWSLEKAISTASKGRRLHVGLKSARSIMQDKWPDYQRSWLFHIDPFQIQGWNLLQHIVLNKENNAIQMYLFPPYKIRNLRFSELGPNHAVAGWEVPLEHTQATTLMKNAPLGDIMQVLMHDNMEGSVSMPTSSFDNIQRPDWLQNTQRASISSSDFRDLQRDLRNAREGLKTSTNGTSQTTKTTHDVNTKDLASLITTLNNLNNVIGTASQVTLANLGGNAEPQNRMETDNGGDVMSRARAFNAKNLMSMEVDRVNTTHAAHALVRELQSHNSDSVSINLEALLDQINITRDGYIQQIQEIVNINSQLQNPLADQTIVNLQKLLMKVCDNAMSINSNEYENLNDKLKQLQDRCTKLRREIEKQNTILSEADKDLQYSEKERQDAIEERDLAYQEAGLARRQLEEKQIVNKTLSQELDKRDRQLQESQGQLQQAHNYITNSRDEMNNYVQNLQGAAQQHALETQTRIQNLGAHYQMKLEEYENVIQVVKATNKILTENSAVDSNTLYNVSSELAEAQKRNHDLSRTLGQYEEARQEFTQKYNEGAAAYFDAMKKLEQSGEVIGNYEETFQKLYEDNQRTNQDLQNCLEELSNYQVLNAKHESHLRKFLKRSIDKNNEKLGNIANKQSRKILKILPKPATREIRESRAKLKEEINAKIERGDRSRSRRRQDEPSTSQSGNGVQPISTTSIVNPPNLAPLPPSQKAIPLY